MRWCTLMTFCIVLTTICADPEPKKYQTKETKVKDKKTNSSLTEDETKFLREVEMKFGVKSDVQEDLKENNDGAVDDVDDKVLNSTSTITPPALPAVIAIEIVNDTDSKSKGKRTIDANLGYGYRTNNGYTYTYFGKPAQEKGKFMIYPYSQEDIPPKRSVTYNGLSQPILSNKYFNQPYNVQIQPSRAFELVPVKDQDQNSYQYRKPVTEFKSEFENIKGLESPPPYIPPQDHALQGSPPSTLYTTYNGEQLTGLTGHFPSVMPNYLVDPNQLLKNPQFQNVGLTQDHLRPHGMHLEKRVVPVLVLRIPSSYLKNPSAELYANLPQNYPLSQHLNNVNLQELVNNYFKKIGYPFAPQLMTYQNSPIASEFDTPVATPVTNYEPQHYANPYVGPSYTQADYSGIQYSAVQPVMAKYSSSNPEQRYFIPQNQPLYQQAVQKQNYEYQYQYDPQNAAQPQTYHVPQDAQAQSPVVSSEVSKSQHDYDTPLQETTPNEDYGVPLQENVQGPSQSSSEEYGTPETHQAVQYVSVQTDSSQYEAPKAVTPNYDVSKEEQADYAKKFISQEYGPTKVPIPVYKTPQYSQSINHNYYTSKQPVQKETIMVYPARSSHTMQRYHIYPESGTEHSYRYQQQVNEDTASKTIVISENYPSKDHTHATVLPFSYKPVRKHHKEVVQSVDYVTPVPNSSKYQSQYKVMVPQTVLKSSPNEKVSYVNSQSAKSHFIQVGPNSEYNPEDEYTAGSKYIPPVGTQKPPYYPRNYHTHPKRMTKPENKAEASLSKKKNDRSEKKKSS